MDEHGAAAMEARLKQWRRDHPQATFDEIEDAVQAEVEHWQAQVMRQLVAGEAAPEMVPAAGPACPSCGGHMQRCGRRAREVVSRMGQPIRWERPYYVCPACGAGLFPPR